MSLKNAKILITAGPTWVPVDSVRVISNTASGQTGMLLAEKLNRSGARVTLLLGPVGDCSLDKKIRVKRFCFFWELKSRLEHELKTAGYDALIHTAAVSDYRLSKTFKQKLRSGIKRLRLELVPTPKIINAVKNIAPSLLAVGFKFQPQASKAGIIREARALMRAAKLDLVVANTITQDLYRAYIAGPNGVSGPYNTKKAMAGALTSLIGIELSGAKKRLMRCGKGF